MLQHKLNINANDVELTVTALMIGATKSTSNVSKINHDYEIDSKNVRSESLSCCVTWKSLLLLVVLSIFVTCVDVVKLKVGRLDNTNKHHRRNIFCGFEVSFEAIFATKTSLKRWQKQFIHYVIAIFSLSTSYFYCCWCCCPFHCSHSFIEMSLMFERWSAIKPQWIEKKKK